MSERDQLDTAVCRNLLFALDRLALGFESEDPHIRHESKSVARQNIEGLAYEVSNGRQ